ncbi:CsiV family protein [Acidihalobacter ferrooxydans]|uniref:Peptidoglycan-binding protein CsiV n=1 Tax=Acidihalobacter ferrooxydans TaxID=1765967 RepID=A0A1P8UH66_9GAMM|nr:CsiV family protein [Acidihalobacter ferrooxydans]APZ43193.1 hypothetical protein BW247_08895 [Acidihalobacter ferrooxydans]
MPAFRQLLIITLACAGVWLPLSQASAETTQTKPQNSYRVEMVFFTFNSPDNFDQENWQQGLPSPDPAHALNLFGGQSAPGFRALPATAYQLDAAAQRLQASGRYTVIGHIAWVQPGLSIGHAVPIEINMGANYAPLYPSLTQPRFTMRNGQTVEIPAQQQLYQLAGTVKIVLSRYLHLYTDLVLRVPTEPAALPAPAGTQTMPPGALPIDAPQLVEDVPVIQDPQHARPAAGGTLTDVHIVEHRRTRSRVLNYVDQPMLGILFEIWPIGNSR